MRFHLAELSIDRIVKKVYDNTKVFKERQSMILLLPSIYIILRKNPKD